MYRPSCIQIDIPLKNFLPRLQIIDEEAHGHQMVNLVFKLIVERPKDLDLTLKEPAERLKTLFTINQNHTAQSPMCKTWTVE